MIKFVAGFAWIVSAILFCFNAISILVFSVTSLGCCISCLLLYLFLEKIDTYFWFRDLSKNSHSIKLTNSYKNNDKEVLGNELFIFPDTIYSKITLSLNCPDVAIDNLAVCLDFVTANGTKIAEITEKINNTKGTQFVVFDISGLLPKLLACPGMTNINVIAFSIKGITESKHKQIFTKELFILDKKTLLNDVHASLSTGVTRNGEYYNANVITADCECITPCLILESKKYSINRYSDIEFKATFLSNEITYSYVIKPNVVEGNSKTSITPIVDIMVDKILNIQQNDSQTTYQIIVKTLNTGSPYDFSKIADCSFCHVKEQDQFNGIRIDSLDLFYSNPSGKKLSLIDSKIFKPTKKTQTIIPVAKISSVYVAPWLKFHVTLTIVQNGNQSSFESIFPLENNSITLPGELVLNEDILDNGADIEFILIINNNTTATSKVKVFPFFRTTNAQGQIDNPKVGLDWKAEATALLKKAKLVKNKKGK